MKFDKVALIAPVPEDVKYMIFEFMLVPIKSFKRLSQFLITFEKLNEGCGCNGSNESVSCVSYKGTEMILEAMISDLWAEDLVEKSINNITNYYEI